MYQQPQPPNYYPPQPQQGQGVYQQQVQQQQQQQQQQQSMMMPGQAMQHQHQQQQQPQMLQQPPQMMHHQHQNQHQQPQMQHQQPQMQQQPVMSRQPQPQMQQQQQQQPPQQQQQQRAPVRSPQYSRPPYVDPNTNIIYDTDNAEYEGFLTKQSMWLKDWRRRFFLLKGSKLFYCSNEYSTPHGMIDLALCTTVKSADLKSRKRNSFEISTPEITYLLYADTEQEKDDWIGRVGKAIVRCSSTYYSQSASGSGVRTTIGGGQRAPNPYGGGYGQNHPHSAIDSDDDDIYYEDPNNPNPYFND